MTAALGFYGAVGILVGLGVACAPIRLKDAPSGRPRSALVQAAHIAANAALCAVAWPLVLLALAWLLGYVDMGEPPPEWEYDP